MGAHRCFTASRTMSLPTERARGDNLQGISKIVYVSEGNSHSCDSTITQGRMHKQKMGAQASNNGTEAQISPRVRRNSAKDSEHYDTALHTSIFPYILIVRHIEPTPNPERRYSIANPALPFPVQPPQSMPHRSGATTWPPSTITISSKRFSVSCPQHSTRFHVRSIPALVSTSHTLTLRWKPP